MKKLIKKVLFHPPVAKVITGLLSRLHQSSYAYVGAFAVAAEGGLHPKHRLMNYHMFFVNNLSKGDRVLDIGCGNGALLKDIALKTDARAVGVELSEENVTAAREMLSGFPKVEIINTDIWEYSRQETFDAIILSNVLEHIEKRVELLQYLKIQFSPNKILLRVPMFEREWLVPYKKELGIEWRLDETHEIEYTEAEFRDEISAAGLELEKLVFQWGEMYAVAKSST